MLLLIDICTFPWWLLWLLPFLLGLLAGWFLWGRFKGMIADLESEISKLKAKISGLEGDLEACNAKRAELNSDLTLCEGRLKEAKAESANTTKATPPPAAKPSGGSVDSSALGIMGAAASTAKTTAPSSTGEGKKNVYAALTSDNLQVVEGIGPKMDSVLKKYDIHTWKELSQSTKESLRGLLDKENPTRYRIIDPTTWPSQAKLAHEGNWDDLIAMQKQLDTGRANTGGKETDSKVEKILIKLGVLKRWKQDDLKAVEGIGPKIEGLLKADGIDTWRKLANSSVDTIQAILTKAGKRYKLADPATWPKQSEMCADGRWDDLQEYQDFLQGGK